MQTDFASIFDSKMTENNLFKKVTELFSKFGLSQYESYIYIFLAKNGRKTASQIYKTLRMPKTETYRILAKLQGKGLVSSSFDHPMTYTASPINKVIESLINQEKNRVKELEAQKQEMIEIFRKIPSIGSKEAKKKWKPISNIARTISDK
jgi:sugar-specific transcriptional regulator TrmB